MFALIGRGLSLFLILLRINNLLKEVFIISVLYIQIFAGYINIFRLLVLSDCSSINTNTSNLLATVISAL